MPAVLPLCGRLEGIASRLLVRSERIQALRAARSALLITIGGFPTAIRARDGMARASPPREGYDLVARAVMPTLPRPAERRHVDEAHYAGSEMVRQGYALDWPRYSDGLYSAP